MLLCSKENNILKEKGPTKEEMVHACCSGGLKLQNVTRVVIITMPSKV